MYELYTDCHALQCDWTAKIFDGSVTSKNFKAILLKVQPQNLGAIY